MAKTTKSNRLNCFSPPVMLATFIIELFGAAILLAHYRSSKAAKLTVALLVCLSIFQLAEYNVCEGALGMSSLDYARVGYLAITALPPLGLHLILTIAGKDGKNWLRAAYGSAGLFAAYFLFSGNGLDAGACMGNYVIFTMAPHAGYLYCAYYYGWLLAAVGLAWKLAKNQVTHIRQALLGLVVGYAAFIVPTALANLVDPSTMKGIPSIMCGFAVILALILMFYVSPRVLQPRPIPGQQRVKQ